MATLPEMLIVAAVNHLISRASWAQQKLAPFQGRSFSVSCERWRVRLTVAERGHLVAAATPDSGEVNIAVPLDTPLRLLRGRAEVMAAAHISGPADFADTLGFVLRNLDWDAEADAARLIGDIAAHRLFGALRTGLDWQRQAMENFGRNLSEYAVFEAGLLPQAGEVRELGSAIGDLELDIARLETRAQALLRAKPANR